MQVFHSIDKLRQEVARHKARGAKVALVPTMGNLHDGHLRLIEEAGKHADWVLCSIFVNPMQFGPGEDLEAYPRTLKQDISRLAGINCDGLFQPDISEIYPQGLENQTIVTVPDLASRHCGASRPGHFNGVTTVVSKLFNLCQPDQAYFGLKDYQQYLLIQKMVSDLFVQVDIRGVETVREADGLALSSRNSYLTEAERRIAPVLYRTLQATRDRIQSGDREYRSLESAALQELTDHGLNPEYFTINNGDSLLPAAPTDSFLAVLAAARLGKTRLIDNIRFTVIS